MVSIALVLFDWQVTELQIEINEKGMSQVIEEAEDDDYVEDFEGLTEGSDDEYVPVAKPGPSAMPSDRKRRACIKTDKTEREKAAEEDSNKDSVQCPTCGKSFKSKYYLKVHNR